MAKKSKTKPPSKPSAKRRAPVEAKGPRKAAGGSKGRTKQPRQGALIEDARIAPLDDIASSIGDCRDNMNELRSEEKGYLQQARSLMHKYNKSVYKHAGVEIVLVPGDEKVRVRVLKDDGQASSTGQDDAGGGEAAEDQGDGAGE